MIPDKLYELAFTYKSTKLWNILFDDDIFAVKLSDGKIGYCSCMGSGGEFISLALYVGAEGYDCLRTIGNADLDLMDSLDSVFFSQDCIQCAFENKSELSKEETAEVQKYARAHKISLRGRKSFPHFIRYRPYYCPWHLTSQTEQKYIGEALCAAIEAASKLAAQSKELLGFAPEPDEQTPIPYLEKKDGTYIWGTIERPMPLEKVYIEPQYTNDIMITKIKRASKNGIWECEITHLPQPAEPEDGGIPMFPTVCLMVERDTEFLLPVPAVMKFERDSDELLEKIADTIIQNEEVPRVLAVRDKQTEVFLKDFCQKTEITLQVCDDLEVMDDLKSQIFDRFAEIDENDLDEMLSTLMLLNEQQMIPLDIMEQIEDLIRQLEAKEPPKKKVKAGSYVISVSIAKGCYRHIQISADSTLYDLSSAILNAFEFDNDHAHAFFMDNRSWSTWDTYYMMPMEPGDRTTDEYKLKQLDLESGTKFKYLFDFGDNWEFQCKVLRILKEDTLRPMVVRTKGKAPSQYGS